MRFKICFLFCIVSYPILSQSFNIDASIATDTENNLFLYNIAPGIGHSFLKSDYLYGGFKFQSYSLISRADRDENDFWSTNNILNFMVFGGWRYNQHLFRFNRGEDNEHIVGIYPDGRFYFNPYLPRSIKYVDDIGSEIKQTGDYATQFAYGVGVGVFFKQTQNNAYFSVKFEYSNIDAFATLRNLEYGNKHFNFPQTEQYSIGISIFFQ